MFSCPACSDLSPGWFNLDFRLSPEERKHRVRALSAVLLSLAGKSHRLVASGTARVVSTTLTSLHSPLRQRASGFGLETRL